MRHLILVLTIELFCNYCYGQTNNWANRIKCSVHLPLGGVISSRQRLINTLEIDGKTFDNVRGFQPHYLVLTNIQSIIFVVDEPDLSISYHVFNMQTDQDTKIKAKGDLFGNLIGFKQLSSLNLGSNFVEVINSNLISTCVTMPYDTFGRSPAGASQQYVRLDLLKKMVASREEVITDTNGIVTKRTFKNYSKP